MRDSQATPAARPVTGLKPPIRVPKYIARYILGDISMNEQWDAERIRQMAMHFAQKFGREQQRWARRAAAGFGAAVRGGKMLADGDLRLIVLLLLEQGPRHGYDIIK